MISVFSINFWMRTSKIVFILVSSCIFNIVSGENDVINFNTQKTLPLSCDAEWNLTSSNMQKIAYLWTHENKIDNWVYRDTTVPRITKQSDKKKIMIKQNINCSLIEYDTVVKVPKALKEILPSSMAETHVHKQVCANSQELRERVRFSKIILLGSFDLTINSVIDNGKHQVVFDFDTNIALPWFAKPFQTIAYKHLQKSIEEYLELLAKCLCES